MKKFSILLVTLLTLIGGKAFSQQLQIVKDTLKGFQIGVPEGWMHSLSDAKLDLVAIRLSKNSSDIPRENFNINIVYRKESDIDITYGQFLESIGKVDGFNILEEGEEVINGTRYKYLIETHKNKISKEDMTDYVFFANKNGKILILTMVTITPNFNDHKSLFEKIGKSLTY